MEKVVRTVCQSCHPECGVFVHVKDDKVIKIEGDPNNPMSRGYTCVKCRNEPERLDHPDRILFPQKRVGQRGSGKWERVSWDTALSEIAEKVSNVKDMCGPLSIAAIHGTGPRPSLYAPTLLVNALGSPNVISVDLHICFLPSIVAEHWTMGGSVMMEKGPDYLNSKCIMLVGGNPLASHPPRGLDILNAKKKNGAKLIVVDPYRTELAEMADLWLQIRPGTDLALIMGMINYIIKEKLHDIDFVGSWCHGFDQLVKRAEKFPLDKVSNITWIPTNMIEEAARIYACTKPSALHHRVAVEHNLNSTQTCRALSILIGLTGNLDVKGGNIMPVSIDGYLSHADLLGEDYNYRLSKEVEAQRIGADQYPLIAGYEATLPIVAAPVAQDAISSGEPYPLKAIFCAGGNPVVLMQNSKKVWNTWKNNLDLLVVSEFFMTPTAEIADYVLPAATWLERDDLCDVMYLNYIAARQKVVEPRGEAWHDMKITIELIKKLPWADRRFVPWNNVEEFLEYMLSNTETNFKDLKRISAYEVPLRYKKYEEVGFKTPTKKFELYSTMFEKYGYEPLPDYVEPPESPISTPELVDEYPLILYTGNRHLEYYHSQGRQIPSLRKLVPDPLVELNPETANKLGFEDGDWLWIETPQVKGERVRMRLRVTDRVHPKMVMARHGWWFPEKPDPEHGCFDSNINVILTDDPPREPICSSVRTRGTLCKIYI